MHLVVTGPLRRRPGAGLDPRGPVCHERCGRRRGRERVAHPRGDGRAEITSTVGGKKPRPRSKSPASPRRSRCRSSTRRWPRSPKQGCNSGACHGSPSGKGGFRLSLRAFDPALDKLTLIREDLGRRTNPLEPDESLLLNKPLMKVPHGGGLKLQEGRPGLRRAAATGSPKAARPTPPTAPRCVKIEVYPPSGRLLKRPAHTQQLVRAGPLLRRHGPRRDRAGLLLQLRHAGGRRSTPAAWSSATTAAKRRSSSATWSTSNRAS